MFRFLKTILFVVAVVLVFLLLDFKTFAQNNDETNLEEVCQWEKIKEKPKDFSNEDYEFLLKKCQDYYQKRSKEIENDIYKTAKEKKTLKNQIYILQNKLKNLDYQINQTNIMIRDLSNQLQNTRASIDKTNLIIENLKEKIAALLRLRYEEDQWSTVEILLSGVSLSDFFDTLVALEVLNLKLQDLLATIKGLKADLEKQKENMDREKKELENLVIVQTLQKEDSAKKKKEQEYFLKLTEKEYQKYLKEQQETKETVTKIGQLLFELLEVPQGGIKLEDAVKIAKSVSAQTGVRAAFSLAVLWQETRIGKVLGGCYLRDLESGEGIYIKSGKKAPRTMNPVRDIPHFLNIVKSLQAAGKLNTDVFNTPVSCAMLTAQGYFGWGGAMGPAQFIPSTWMLYKEELEKRTGSVPANPWNVRDAFLANGLLLRDNGAGAKTYNAEMQAALRYFGCTSSWCERFYGKPVMNVAACFQDYLDKESMSQACRELIF